MKIGVISDTHNFLDPGIPGLFAGVEHIFHAGDIGLPAILQQLEAIAPVTAVMGNTDEPGLGYRQTGTFKAGGVQFLVHHIVDPRAPSETVERLLARHSPDAVIFGHTHKPFSETINGIFFFNPGYAGKPRFGLPRTVAILDCNSTGIQSTYVPL